MLGHQLAVEPGGAVVGWECVERLGRQGGDDDRALLRHRPLIGLNSLEIVNRRGILTPYRRPTLALTQF